MCYESNHIYPLYSLTLPAPTTVTNEPFPDPKEEENLITESCMYVRAGNHDHERG